MDLATIVLVRRPMAETLARRRDEQFFLEGPHSRLSELRFALGVFREFIAGFRALHFVGPCVTVFGSARFQEGHPFYEKGRELGRKIASDRRFISIDSPEQLAGVEALFAAEASAAGA